jgi:hypothetical protein
LLVQVLPVQVLPRPMRTESHVRQSVRIVCIGSE